MQKVSIFCTGNDHLHAFHAPIKIVQIGWGHHVNFCVWENRPLLLAKVVDGQYPSNIEWSAWYEQGDSFISKSFQYLVLYRPDVVPTSNSWRRFDDEILSYRYRFDRYKNAINIPVFAVYKSDIYPTWYGHDDVIKWEQLPRYWSLMWEIHRSPANFPHKDQWPEALMLSLICAWTKGWVSNRYAGDLRRHRIHYDVNVMSTSFLVSSYVGYRR